MGISYFESICGWQMEEVCLAVVVATSKFVVTRESTVLASVVLEKNDFGSVTQQEVDGYPERLKAN
jgi:hypothetical protein